MALFLILSSSCGKEPLAEKGPIISVFMSPAAAILIELTRFTCSPTQAPPHPKNSSDCRVRGDPCNTQDLKSSSFEERVRIFPKLSQGSKIVREMKKIVWGHCAEHSRFEQDTIVTTQTWPPDVFTLKVRVHPVKLPSAEGFLCCL